MKKGLFVISFLIIICLLVSSCYDKSNDDKNLLRETINQIIEDDKKDLDLEADDKLINEDDPENKYQVPDGADSPVLDYWLNYYETAGQPVIPISALVLYSYGDTFADDFVMTAFRVDNVGYSLLQHITENNTTGHYVSIVAYFNDRNEIQGINSATWDAKDMIAIVGQVDKKYNYNYTTTVKILNSKIIATGDEAQQLFDELKERQEDQIRLAAEKGVYEPLIPLPE